MNSNSKPLYLQALDALRSREMLFRIFIFTLVTVVFWIGFSIFFSQQKTKVAIDIRKHTEPLNPNINKDVLDELALRKTYSDAELENFPIYDRVVGEDKTSKLVIAGTETTDNNGISINVTTEIATPSAKLASPSALFQTPVQTPTTPAPTTSEATASGNL